MVVREAAFRAGPLCSVVSLTTLRYHAKYYISTLGLQVFLQRNTSEVATRAWLGSEASYAEVKIAG